MNATEQVTPQVTPQVDIQAAILEFCKAPKSLKEIMNEFGFKDRKNFMERHIKPLIDLEKMEITLPDKPNSRNQKYVRK